MCFSSDLPRGMLSINMIENFVGSVTAFRVDIMWFIFWSVICVKLSLFLNFISESSNRSSNYHKVKISSQQVFPNCSFSSLSILCQFLKHTNEKMHERCKSKFMIPWLQYMRIRCKYLLAYFRKISPIEGYLFFPHFPLSMLNCFIGSLIR